jgi:hypothetical protein
MLQIVREAGDYDIFDKTPLVLGKSEWKKRFTMLGSERKHSVGGFSFLAVPFFLSSLRNAIPSLSIT